MAKAAAAALFCVVAISPNALDAADRFEWLVIVVFVGFFCAALAVRSLYRRRNKILELFLFIFEEGGKTWGFAGFFA